MLNYVYLILGLVIGAAFISSGVAAFRRRRDAEAPRMFGEREWRNAVACVGVFCIAFGIAAIIGSVVSFFNGG